MLTYAEVKDVIVNAVLSKKDGMTVSEVIEETAKVLKLDSVLLSSPDDRKSLESLVKSVLHTEPSNATGFISVCTKKRKGAKQYKLRQAKVKAPQNRQKPDTDTDDTNYIGKAGEFAVLAELIARGYNANNMAIDEGIDIVASKDNVFYYIQVKTTYVDTGGRVCIHIPVVNYKRVESNNAIYIIALRECIGSFRYFIFHQYEIEAHIINGYIERTEANINIKIAYDEITNQPFLYNGKNRTTARSHQAEITNFKL